MRKYSKMLIFVMLTLVLMAGSAFAGTISFTGAVNAINAPFTVALEAMGAARNLTQSGVPAAANIAGVGVGNNIAAIRILPGQALASGSLLTVTFANAAFDGSQVFLCEYDATNNGQSILLAPLSAPTTTVNSATQSFVISRATGGSNYVVMTTGANTANCANISGAFIYRLQPVTSAAMASVAYNASLSGTVYDSASATNFANISASFATAYGANNSTIDFSNSSTSNGAHFISAVGANTANAAAVNIALTAMNVNVNSAGTVNAGLTVSAILSLQDSASWQGVQRVYMTTGAGNICALASNNAIATTLSGTVNLAPGLFAGAASNSAAVCADVTGNAALLARTIKGAYDITVGSGGVDPAIDTFTTIMTWNPNGYQGIIPYISASSTYSTLCFIDNKSTMSAPVTIDIVTTESGATLTSLTGLSAGSVAAGKTMRVDIDSSIHPYTYSGTTETAGTTIPLTGVQSNDRLSAMINVGAAPAQVIVNCLQLDPSGSKRAVPVLTQADGAALPWQQ